MPPERPPRPNALIDALDKKAKEAFEGRVWRVVRAGRDVLRAGRPGGRWDDGTFDVLYTSTTRDGALAELYFHLSQGQPVVPSQVQYFVHEIAISLQAMLDLRRLADLAALNVNINQFGQSSYLDHRKEYPTTQQVGEVAHFLEFDSIMVPSARSQAPNLVIFCQKLDPTRLTSVESDGPIDWSPINRQSTPTRKS